MANISRVRRPTAIYACLHASDTASAASLRDLALQFSSIVEQTSENTVTFPIARLRRLIGSPYQIASEISRVGYRRRVQASLAIASNPDAATLLAQNFNGVTLVTPGEEKLKLETVPLTALFAEDKQRIDELLEVFENWGLKTCGDLAALPEQAVKERLGKTGAYLRNLASGLIDRPLHPSAFPAVTP